MYYQIEMEVNARFGHCADTSFACPFTDTERPRPYDLVCRIRFGGGNIIPSDMSHRPTMLVPVSPDSRGLTHFFGFCLAGDRGGIVGDGTNRFGSGTAVFDTILRDRRGSSGERRWGKDGGSRCRSRVLPEN